MGADSSDLLKHNLVVFRDGEGALQVCCYVLFYAVLCCAVLCCAELRCAVLCCAALCCAAKSAALWPTLTHFAIDM